MTATTAPLWINALSLFLVASGVGCAANDDLFERYFRWKVSECNPERGLRLGLHDATELNDMSLAFQASVRKSCQDFGNEAMSRNDVVDDYSRKYLKLLREEADDCVEGFDRCSFHLLAKIDHVDGVQVGLPRLFSNGGEARSVGDLKNALVRLSKIPKQLQDVEELLREGAKRKVTHANETLLRARPQFEALQADTPEESPFYDVFRAVVAPNNDSEVSKVRAEARSRIRDDVLPAFKTLQDYVYGEYAGLARRTPGIHSNRGGDRCYRRRVKRFAPSSGFSAERIHNIGLDEVAMLRTKMEEAIDRRLANVPNTRFSSLEDAVEFVRDQLKVVSRSLERIFGRAVLTEDVYDVDVRLLPPRGPAVPAQYVPGTSGRKGTVYVNPAWLSRLERGQALALAMHEANPGHHLQLTVARTGDLHEPRFARLPVPVADWAAAHDPFVEGWASYAEGLGEELGLFEGDPLLRTGFESWAVLRAARLVVDTGIHAFRWSRKEAVEYLLENTGFDRWFCELEVDAVITSPGRALSAKMGEMAISALRHRMEREAAERNRTLQLGRFHDSVLGCKWPLRDLEACVKDAMDSSHVPIISGADLGAVGSFSFTVVASALLTTAIGRIVPSFLDE